MKYKDENDTITVGEMKYILNQYPDDKKVYVQRLGSCFDPLSYRPIHDSWATLNMMQDCDERKKIESIKGEDFLYFSAPDPITQTEFDRWMAINMEATQKAK